MNAEAGTSLNHYAALRFTAAFWQLDAGGRRERVTSVVEALRAGCDAVHLYQSHPIETGTDILIWTGVRMRDTGTPRSFFENWSRAMLPLRGLVEERHLLWGFTRASQYSKAKSSQEIEPFSDERATYLVMYPFTKTAEWYLLGPDARQGMMNQHMRLGKQYREISQLLLYSFGLQDQEFVVVYETEDLEMFSKLVYELRGTEARRFTKEDTPFHTGVHRSLEELLALLT